MNLVTERLKRSFFSFPKKFWIREYIISLIIFTIMTVYNVHNAIDVIPLTLLMSVNLILFPFSKVILFQLKLWWYEYVYQVDPNTVLKSVGFLTLIGKGIKNFILFLLSFIVGILGIILLLLIAPKKEEN